MRAVGVETLQITGRSCIYPGEAHQLMTKDGSMTISLKPTNEPCVIEKSVELRLCESFNPQFESDSRMIRSANLDGSIDNFRPECSQIISALLSRVYKASQGGYLQGRLVAGKSCRDLPHADDAAKTNVFVSGFESSANQANSIPMLSRLNVDNDDDVSRATATLSGDRSRVDGLGSEIRFVTSKPDQTPRMLLDVSRLSPIGGRTQAQLGEGLQGMYQWNREHRIRR